MDWKQWVTVVVAALAEVLVLVRGDFDVTNPQMIAEALIVAVLAAGRSALGASERVVYRVPERDLPRYNRLEE